MYDQFSNLLVAINEIDVSSANSLSAEEFLIPIENIKQYERGDDISQKLYSITTQGYFSFPTYSESRSTTPQEIAEFLARIPKYRKNKEANIKKLELEVRKQEERECSFKPKIITPKSVSSKFRNKNSKRKDIEFLELNKEERERVELTNCTFKPFIHSKDAKPRYMINNNTSFYNKDKETLFTFSPKVVSLTRKSERLKEHLSVDPYKRLFETKKKFVKSEQMKVEDKAKGNNKVFERFYLRQCEDKQKQKRKSQRFTSSVSIDFKPTINERSKEMMKRLGSTKKKEKLEKRNAEYESIFTFSPKILPYSRQMSPKSPEEMNMVVIDKERKVAKLRKELLKNESKPFTFRPMLKSPPFPTESRLKLIDNLDIYLYRVSKKEEDKEKASKLHKQMREIKEIEKCTHKPKINPYPRLLKHSVSPIKYTYCH